MTAAKARCFSMRILGYDPYADEALTRGSGITLVSLSELLKESDFVSIHAPLTKDTRHLVGEKEFRQMKRSAYLINTSRGAVLDEAALIKALQQGWLAGAGLDVFEKEPLESESPLLSMSNVIVSPHVAYYSKASLKRLKSSVGQEVARVLAGFWPKHAVNRSVVPKVSLRKGGA